MNQKHMETVMSDFWIGFFVGVFFAIMVFVAGYALMHNVHAG